MSDLIQLERAAEQPPTHLLAYKAGDRCQRCGCSNWWVRATTAECGNCNDVMPVARPGGADVAASAGLG
ncbi:MAG: hypothetical protein ACRCVX_12625 [Shewanella sp.]